MFRIPRSRDWNAGFAVFINISNKKPNRYVNTY